MPPPILAADEIANCVLRAFNALPRKCKPRQLADGRREVVALAGIVLSKGPEPTKLTCAALATGMKCLPLSKVSLAHGSGLHDWHAEVLALRAFNRFLIDECADLARKESLWVRWRRREDQDQEQPFELAEDVRIHLYCSEAPCGDASMELVMRSQEDDTPWTTVSAGMLGRGNFDQLGVVRRKPARPDAPITLSKSCSDKIAMKQVTGLLSGLASLLVHPRGTYLETLVVPESQCVPAAMERAFGIEGRMRGLGEEMKPFEVKTTSLEFDFSRRVVGGPPVPSNLSALFTPHRQEVLVNGVLQGRKQFDVKGASCVSRRLMWKSAVEVAVDAGLPALVDVLKKKTYREVKDSAALRRRKEEKRRAIGTALGGWEQNADDDDWGLDG